MRRRTDCHDQFENWSRNDKTGRLVPRAGGQWPPLRGEGGSEAGASGWRPMAAPTGWVVVGGWCRGRALGERPYDAVGCRSPPAAGRAAHPAGKSSPYGVGGGRRPVTRAGAR